MALKQVTVEVPEHLAALVDQVSEIVADAKGKEWGQVVGDVLQVVQSFQSMDEIKAELKDPAVAVAAGLLLGKLVQQFLPAAPVAAPAQA